MITVFLYYAHYLDLFLLLGWVVSTCNLEFLEKKETWAGKEKLVIWISEQQIILLLDVS